jgi:ribose transport system substrate-binding protein
MRGNHWKYLVALAAMIGALALGACGGDDDDGNGSGGGADVTAAESAITPFIGKPSDFPVTEPLEKVPTGAQIAFVDCGTPVCALFWELIQPAGQTMGVEISRIRAGQSADTVSAAFDTIVSQKPDGVIVTSINPQLWQNQLTELQDAGIPVVTTGIADAADYGIESPQASQPEQQRDGALLADYIVANFAGEGEIALYTVPELTLTAPFAESFSAEIEKICPDCSVRMVDVPVATIGNTAPNMIVSDLQANPDTAVAAFALDEVQNGLPAAMQTAGIDIPTIGYAPTPTNLQYIQEGQQDATLATDLPVLIWTTLDQVAREMAGQELSGGESEGLTVIQFLTQEDITFDPSMGWTGYPDFAERFAKLWGVGG